MERADGPFSTLTGGPSIGPGISERSVSGSARTASNDTSVGDWLVGSATANELDRLPAAAQDRRDEATEVLSYARRHGLGLSDAVRQLGMPGADRTVQFFFPDAVQRTRAGLVPTERDEAFWLMAALTPRGWVEVETRDSATASILGAHADR